MDILKQDIQAMHDYYLEENNRRRKQWQKEDMQILIKIDKDLADRLLRIVKADNTQDAVVKTLTKFVNQKEKQQ